MRADRAGYYEVDAAGWVTASRGITGTAALPDGFRIADFGQQVLDSYAAGRTVVIGDMAADDRFSDGEREPWRASGLSGGLGVPLVKGGRLCALLALNNIEPREWTDAEVTLVEEVAERTWATVERARAEAALRESEERLRRIFETDAVGVLFFNHEDVLIGANEVFLKMTGWSREDVESRSLDWRRITPPEWIAESEEQMRRLAETGRIGPYEKEYFRKDGSRAWMLFAGRDLGDGTIVEFGIDIEDRKRAEAALREVQERFRQFGEASSDVLWTRDADTLRWDYLTPAFERIYGLSRDSVLQGNDFRNWVELIVPEDRDHAVETICRVREGEHVTFEYRIRRPSDGHVRWLRNTAFPIRDLSGRVHRIGGIKTDITAEKKTSEHMQVLVDELQHRTRNLIAVVRSIAQQTMAQTGPGEEFRDRFNDRLEALARVQGLLSRVKEERVTIGQLIRMELDALGAKDFGDRITLDGPDVTLRNSVVQTLALALHELATNARKYGSLATDRGVLDVSWRVREADGEGRRLGLQWVEKGIKHARDWGNSAPQGYGRELIERALPYSLNARTSFELGDNGVRCTIDLPLEKRSSPRSRP
jgi:two-component system CheB/CheR fusion protein